MRWSEESANRALELIRSPIAQGATVDEAMAIFLPSGHAIDLVLARAAHWLEVKKREADAGDRSPTYVRDSDALSLRAATSRGGPVAASTR